MDEGLQWSSVKKNNYHTLLSFSNLHKSITLSDNHLTITKECFTKNLARDSTFHWNIYEFVKEVLSKQLVYKSDNYRLQNCSGETYKTVGIAPSCVSTEAAKSLSTTCIIKKMEIMLGTNYSFCQNVTVILKTKMMRYDLRPEVVHSGQNRFINTTKNILVINILS